MGRGLNRYLGDVLGENTIHQDINGLIDRYKLNVQEVAIDRMFQGLDLIRRLATDDGLTAFAHGQGSLGMIPPTKVAKDAILGGTLKHNRNPVLRWMMNNVVVHPGEGKEYPMRDKSADKIDGVVAMIMAVGRADMQPVRGNCPFSRSLTMMASAWGVRGTCQPGAS
jgi:phage terminase large subunit-like protein